MSRGAIKYQPFNALEGHGDAFKEKEKELQFIQRPILSEDDCIRINDILIEVINEQLQATFFIFKKNKIIEITSKVVKVLNGYLYLEEDTIQIADLVNIML